MRRFCVPRVNLMVAIALLAAIALLNGAGLLSAWYNNLGSLSLSLEWWVVRESLGVSRCQRWAPHSAAALPIARAVSLDPHNERARLNAGRVAWLVGDCEAALNAWSNLAPHDVIARLEWANGLYAMGREEEAKAAYREIDGAAEYFHIRGEQAAAVKDWDAAVKSYELGMAIAPTRMTAEELAPLYLRSEQPGAAARVWQRVIEATGKSDPDHWWALGQSAELMEEWEAAAEAYERGADRSDTPCSFYQRQAVSLEQLEEWDKAESVSRKALRVCPDLLWPYLRLGDLRRRRADYVSALHWYRQAEMLQPENVNPKYYIGISYYEQEDYHQAKTYFQRTLALAPRHLWSTYYLARSEYQLGDKQSAVEMLSRAMDLQSQQRWDWAVWLGNWYLELGDREKALSAYRRALLWHPGDENIQARIESALESIP